MFTLAKKTFCTKEELAQKLKDLKDTVDVDIDSAKNDNNKLLIRLLEEISSLKQQIYEDLNTKASKEDLGRLEGKIDRLSEITIQVKSVLEYKNEHENR
jgi:vacuolar-type H+-ATPase subunit H